MIYVKNNLENPPQYNFYRSWTSFLSLSNYPNNVIERPCPAKEFFANASLETIKKYFHNA